MNITPNPDVTPSTKFPILDHGYVRLIDSMGNDWTPDSDARISTGIEARNEQERNALIRFLFRHNHTTPFEGCTVKVEVRAPIMVFREWHRHRTQSFNEESGRYKQLDPLYYVPAAERVAKQAMSNKQGSGESYSSQEAEAHRIRWTEEQDSFESVYDGLVQEGMAKEIARLNMPVSHYSTMVATANLLNWFRFLQLRMAPTAQYEIRQYANAIANIIAAKFPVCYKAFEDYWLNSVRFSALEIEMLRNLIASSNLVQADGSLAVPLRTDLLKGRELGEFEQKLSKLM